MNLFNLHYGLKEIPIGKESTTRLSAKAIVRDGNKILLIHTNKGDYKIPGGGYKKGENFESCLKREMKEETGFRIKNIGKRIGKAVDVHIDITDKNKYFCLENDYYHVEIDPTNKVKQSLDEYEKELDFEISFIDLQKAITINEKILQNDEVEINPWVERDTEVLKKLVK